MGAPLVPPHPGSRTSAGVSYTRRRPRIRDRTTNPTLSQKASLSTAQRGTVRRL